MYKGMGAEQMRDIVDATQALLAGQIEQWNETRMTVNATLLLNLRDAYRGKGDKGNKDAYPLRRMVEARRRKAGEVVHGTHDENS